MPRSDEVDFWRQMDVFNPWEFKETIAIVGCGATGSYIAFLLAKMGVLNIEVHDFDKVEDYNLPNQIFGLDDVGKRKVDALFRIILASTGIGIAHGTLKVTKAPQSDYLFILTDTMESRKQIWNSVRKAKKKPKLIIETRMAINGGIIYCIDPSKKDHVERYEKELFPDEEAEESPCTSRAIAPTVAALAAAAVSLFLNHTRKIDVPFRHILSTTPLSVY